MAKAAPAEQLKLLELQGLDAKLKSLTVGQVNAAIRKFLKPEQLSVFVAGDFANAAKAQATTPAK